MPCFVIMESAGRTGEATNGIICDPGGAGWPDRQSDTPVSVRLVSEKTLTVDGEPRQIISAVGINGSTTFLVSGSSKALRNRERRIELARAQSLLLQLATCLRPLRQGSEQSELITEGLGLIQNWLSDEREAATTAPRSIGYPETSGDPRNS